MTDRAEIAAFRFGFGLPLDGPAGPDDLLAQLTGPDQAAQRWPAYGVAEVIPVMQALREARRMAAEAPGDKAAKKAQRRAVKAGGALAVTGAKAALARAVGGPAFRERLVAFWADHFTVVPRSRTECAWPAALVEDAIRPHLAGRFGDMLQAVMTHPAMLIYLDQTQSQGPNSRRGAKTRQGAERESGARTAGAAHAGRRCGLPAGRCAPDWPNC